MTKKIIVALFFICAFSKAQIKKGRIFVGGELGVGRIYTGMGSAAPSIQVKINPNIGYMLTSTLGLRLNIGFSNFGQELQIRSVRSSYLNINVGFGIMFFVPMSDKFAFYVTPAVDVFHTIEKSNASGFFPPDFQNQNYSSVNLGISPSFIYFPHKKVSFNLTLGSFANVIYYTKTEVARFDFINLTTNSPTLGINFWFGKTETSTPYWVE